MNTGGLGLSGNLSIVSSTVWALGLDNALFVPWRIWRVVESERERESFRPSGGSLRSFPARRIYCPALLESHTAERYVIISKASYQQPKQNRSGSSFRKEAVSG